MLPKSMSYLYGRLTVHSSSPKENLEFHGADFLENKPVDEARYFPIRNLQYLELQLQKGHEWQH